MNDCTLSPDSDKPGLELDFFAPLSQYSTSMTMSDADISPLPVYSDSNTFCSFSSLRQDPTALAKMVGHGSSSHSTSMTAEHQKKVKQELRRERNRAAAAKCRQKKLDRITYLQQTAENIRALNEQLDLYRYQLQKEIQELRNRFDDHQRRGCHCHIGLGHGNGH